MNTKQAFLAYSDESGINENDQYTSIALISGEQKTLDCLSQKLTKILKDERVNEVKFLKVTRHKSPITTAARRFIERTINEFACYKRVRVDIITRDNRPLHLNSSDSCKPDLEHLYYCLLSHIIRQWRNTIWNFYPDINSKIDWKEIISFLENTRLYKRNINNPLLIDLILEENPKFQFNEVKQLPSTKEPLIQLADLFAGIARFSHEEDIKCAQSVIRWKSKEQQKLNLNLARDNSIKRSKKCRYQVISELYNLCRKHRFWVSIRTKKHLWTRKPNSFINFWDYKPAR